MADSSFDGQAFDGESWSRSAPRVEDQNQSPNLRGDLAVGLPLVVATQRDLEQSPAVAGFVVLGVAHVVHAGFRFDMILLTGIAVESNEWAALPTGGVFIGRLQPEDEFVGRVVVNRRLRDLSVAAGILRDVHRDSAGGQHAQENRQTHTARKSR